MIAGSRLRAGHNARIGRKFIYSRLKALICHPLFRFLTITGNSFAIVGATAFYFSELDANPKLTHFLDAVWWAFQTVTTVGYGDITPVTSKGKLVGICLMLVGTALFSSFTALFAAILLEPELNEVEDEVRELEKTMLGKN